MSQTHANHDSASPVPHHDSKSKMDQELFWSIYDDRAQKRSKKDLEELSEDLDAHLTFAGLFCAVDTTFIALSFTFIGPGFGVPVDGPSAGSETAVNAAFIISLSCTVFAAFGAVLGKQWASHSFLSVSTKSSCQERALAHQKWLRASESWRLNDILTFIPFVIHVSIVAFCAGIITSLWSQHRALALLILSFASAATLIYFLLFCFSLSDEFSPFQTAMSRSLRMKGQNLILSIKSGWGRLRDNFLLERTTPGVDQEQGRDRGNDSGQRVECKPVREKVENRLGKGNPAEDNKIYKFFCIRWSFKEGADEEIALEASRMITIDATFHDCSLILDFLDDPVAFNHLLINFNHCITGSVDSKSADNIVTYAAAVCHLLLAQPPPDFHHTHVLATILRELLVKQAITSKSGSTSPESDWTCILIDSLWKYYKLGAGISHLAHQFPQILEVTPKYAQSFTTDRRRSLIYLVLSLPKIELESRDRETDEVELVRSEQFCLECARNLSPRQSISLISWFLVEGHRYSNEVYEKEMVQRRWDAYTSRNSVFRELYEVLCILDPSEDGIVISQDHSLGDIMITRLFVELLDAVAWLNRREREENKNELGQVIHECLKRLLRLLESTKDDACKHADGFLSRSPALLIQLASVPYVDDDTRSCALRMVQRFLPGWVDWKHQKEVPELWQQRWGPKFAEGLVHCAAIGAVGSSRLNNDLVKMTFEFATVMSRGDHDILVAILLNEFYKYLMLPSGGIRGTRSPTWGRVALTSLAVWAFISSSRPHPNMGLPPRIADLQEEWCTLLSEISTETSDKRIPDISLTGLKYLKSLNTRTNRKKKTSKEVTGSGCCAVQVVVRP